MWLVLLLELKVDFKQKFKFWSMKLLKRFYFSNSSIAKRKTWYLTEDHLF